MIALLFAVAAAPFAGAFWDRDLGALARELLEYRAAPQAPLFDDLVRLCDCETLPPLETPDPLRQLVRIEAARGARLGAKAGPRRRSGVTWSARTSSAGTRAIHRSRTH